MNTERAPRVLSFVSETAPLAMAVTAFAILVIGFPSSPKASKPARLQPPPPVEDQQATGRDLRRTVAAVPERLPPVAKCERLPAVETTPCLEHEINDANSTTRNAPLPANIPPDGGLTDDEATVTSPTIEATTASDPLARDRNRATWASATSSPSLSESVELQAQDRLRHAYGRADRGALYSARHEFLAVFRGLVQALDSGLEQPVHATCLSQALCALDEADDFVVADQQLASPAQLEGLIASHQTAILANVDTSQLNARNAVQAYYDYASQQLALAGNAQPVAAEVLYSLGRVEMMMIAEASQRTSRAPKAAAYFSAALAVNPNHGLAANELGVLLARSGRLQDASAALEHAARLHATPVVLQNLADVRQRLAGVAGPANQSSNQLTTPDLSGTTLMSRVQFVDPSTFARLSEDSESGTVPTAASAGPPSDGASLGAGNLSPRTADQRSWFGF